MIRQVAKGSLAPSILLFGLIVFAQGIDTSLVHLPFEGEWQGHPEWIKGVDVAQNFVYYDRSLGSVVHIRRTKFPYKVDQLDDMMTQFKRTESSLTERPGFARFLAIAFFPLPESYVRETGHFFNKPGRVPRIWDIRKVETNAQNFYVSQLTPGFIVRTSAGTVEAEEEYTRTKLTRAERRKTNSGEALLFELETEEPATDRVVSYFQMPSGLKNQRIRYGVVIYAADGFAAGTDVLNVAIATPVNSGLDAEKVLAYVTNPTQ